MLLKNITFAQIEAIAERNRSRPQSTAKRKHIEEPVPTGWKPQMSLETFTLKEQRKAYAKSRKHN
jgi:hypothetical protein